MSLDDVRRKGDTVRRTTDADRLMVEQRPQLYRELSPGNPPFSSQGVDRMVVRAVLASVGCAALLVTSAVSAQAATPIQLGRVQYNSPGADRSTNVSLNGEYLVIRNGGTTARSLTGWTVRDAQNHIYTFGTFTLGARRTVALRTGTGLNTQSTRYWGSSNHVWNNSGDKAVLRTAAGIAVDSCSWAANGLGYKGC